MERELVDWIRARVAADARVPLGIGDDAAVLDLPGRIIVSTDMLADGVDFRLDEIDPRRAGHKALGVNLSDLAAMAARPVAAFVSLQLPRHGGQQLAEQLYQGMFALARRWNVVIAGGDLGSWDGPLVVSITVIGVPGPAGAVPRSGAVPGDRILVSGRLGGSILGRHLDVEPRVDEALWLAERYPLHAAIDTSDGTAIDLARLVEASGCGAVAGLLSRAVTNTGLIDGRRHNSRFAIAAAKQRPDAALQGPRPPHDSIR